MLRIRDSIAAHGHIEIEFNFLSYVQKTYIYIYSISIFKFGILSDNFDGHSYLFQLLIDSNLVHSIILKHLFINIKVCHLAILLLRSINQGFKQNKNTRKVAIYDLFTLYLIH